MEQPLGLLIATLIKLCFEICLKIYRIQGKGLPGQANSPAISHTRGEKMQIVAWSSGSICNTAVETAQFVLLSNKVDASKFRAI